VVLRLGSVQPNPVLSRGIVRFELPAPASVRAALFDVAGRRVADLASGAPFPAGSHALIVDRTAMAPGVYLLRVEASGRTSTTKVVVGAR
jgi:hypothetical protein